MLLPEIQSTLQEGSAPPFFLVMGHDWRSYNECFHIYQVTPHGTVLTIFL